ncbi:MAG: ABC transporter permease, partial [Pseudomonadota bacterium]
MPALYRKLLRDLVRLWPQGLAIALVMAAGVTTMVLGVGAYSSLEGTREAYYERNRFAHVFATVTRAPNRLESEIAEIPGVAAVETRVKEMALIDVPNVLEPASGIFVSLPDTRAPRLNRLFMRDGRTPRPGSDREVIVNEAFATAHGFDLGSTFSAVLDGARRDLEIVGIALSPEFIYALGPWDLMPDDRRLAVVWMSEEALAAAYDLDGAFSDVSLLLMRGANEDAVIDDLDLI